MYPADLQAAKRRCRALRAMTEKATRRRRGRGV